jgi:hypothetical protein
MFTEEGRQPCVQPKVFVFMSPCDTVAQLYSKAQIANKLGIKKKRKRRTQQFFYCCMCIRCRGNGFTEPLPSIDTGMRM